MCLRRTCEPAEYCQLALQYVQSWPAAYRHNMFVLYWYIPGTRYFLVPGTIIGTIAQYSKYRVMRLGDLRANLSRASRVVPITGFKERSMVEFSEAVFGNALRPSLRLGAGAAYLPGSCAAKTMPTLDKAAFYYSRCSSVIRGQVDYMPSALYGPQMPAVPLPKFPKPVP